MPRRRSDGAELMRLQPGIGMEPAHTAVIFVAALPGGLIDDAAAGASVLRGQAVLLHGDLALRVARKCDAGARVAGESNVRAIHQDGTGARPAAAYGKRAARRDGLRELPAIFA